MKLKKTDKVLEIGTGSGYQTAIISCLCQKIYTIEIFDELLNQAKINIDKLKIRNRTDINGRAISNLFIPRELSYCESKNTN